MVYGLDGLRDGRSYGFLFKVFQTFSQFIQDKEIEGVGEENQAYLLWLQIISFFSDVEDFKSREKIIFKFLNFGALVCFEDVFNDEGMKPKALAYLLNCFYFVDADYLKPSISIKLF